MTATFTTSLEVEVEVFSEGTLTGERQLTTRLPDVRRVDQTGGPAPVPPLLLETDEEKMRADAAKTRRAERLETARDELTIAD